MSLKLDLDKVTQSGSITERGYVADARELNAGIDGTIANKLLELALQAEKIFSTSKPSVKDANEAPDGVCLLQVNGQNNPYINMATLITFSNASRSYRQQFAIPQTIYESNILCYRVMQNNTWGDWKKFKPS